MQKNAQMHTYFQWGWVWIVWSDRQSHYDPKTQREAENSCRGIDQRIL